MADAFVREYTGADFEALYAIDQACYPPGIAYTRRVLRWFLALDGAIRRVAERDGRIAGFILALDEGDSGHIITLDVLRAHRRQGIGSLLLTSAERELAARGVRQVELETATDNHAAVAFWQKHGYRTCAVLPRYYLGQHDAFWMAKQLDTET